MSGREEINDDYYHPNCFSNDVDNLDYLHEQHLESNRYTDNYLGTKPNTNDYRIIIDYDEKELGKEKIIEDRENLKTRNMFTKYEIPSFYAFQPMDTVSERASDESSSDADLGDVDRDEVDQDVYRWQRRAFMESKTVNKFTLPRYERNTVDELLKTKKSMGQGDSPWIVILDCSSESEVEEETMRLNNKIISQAWQHDDEETQINVDKKNNINSQLNNQHKKTGGEGKISRFFSRLRKTAPSNTQDISTESKDMTNVITSHHDNDTQTKKSKMCTIL